MANTITNHDRELAHFGPSPDPWRNGALRNAVAMALSAGVSGATGNPNPDDPDEPTGPGAPRIRDMSAALALLQAADLLSDPVARATIHDAAAGVLVANAQHFASH